TVAAPSLRIPPPSSVAELPEIMLSLIVTVLARMPPPKFEELAEMVQPMIVSVLGPKSLRLQMPPPEASPKKWSPELPEMVQPMIVSVPPWLAMPPSSPLAMVSPDRLAVWLASAVTIDDENETPCARSTVRLVAPGPWTEMLLFKSGSGLCRSIVPDTLNPMVNL